MRQKDFFNWKEEDQQDLNPDSTGRINKIDNPNMNEKTELLDFTDSVLEVMNRDGHDKVLVQVFGTKKNNIDANKYYGKFIWSPNSETLEEYHLPEVAGSKISNLTTGKYFALVRTPKGIKLGGTFIEISKNNAPVLSEEEFLTSNNKEVLETGEADNLNNTTNNILNSTANKINKILHKRLMDTLEKSLNNSFGAGEENAEIADVKKEVLTLKGIIAKQEAEKKQLVEREKEREKQEKIDLLSDRVKKLNSELEEMKNKEITQKMQKKKRTNPMELIKTVVEMKDSILPLVQGLGLLGNNQQNNNNNNLGFPQNNNNLNNNANNINTQGVHTVFDKNNNSRNMQDYLGVKNTNSQKSSFSENEEDNIRFSAFDEEDEDLKNDLFKNEYETQKNELKISKEKLKNLSTQILKVIYTEFKKTDEIKIVVPEVKKNIRENFWDYIELANIKQEVALEKGLNNSKEFAESLMQYIPVSLLELIDTDDKNYKDMIKKELENAIKLASLDYLER